MTHPEICYNFFMTFKLLSSEEILKIEEKLLSEIETLSLSPLNNISKFSGAGVYVLYYTGKYLDQHSLVGPIYIGKAIPAGGRKGIDVVNTGTPLFNRIKQHHKSIESASNLEVKDFYVRYLILDPLWITICETLLINYWKPLWNSCLDGFGNHDPGSNRRSSIISRWDTIHPGRRWASSGSPRMESVEQIKKNIETVLNLQTPANTATIET